MLEPWHRDLIDELRVARLATISADGRPHLVPVCYALLEDRIAFPIDEKPKRSLALQRIRNIERDPRVTLLFDRYDDDWRRLAWVRIHAHARTIAAGAEWPEALAALRRRYAQYRAMPLEDLPLVAVTPDRVAAWRISS